MIKSSEIITAKITLVVLIFVFLSVNVSLVSGQSASPNQPTLFENGLISTGNINDELFLTFAPDGKTIFFVRRVPGGLFTIYTSQFKNKMWSAPNVASFSGKYKDQGPFISPDGKKLFFYSNRPKRVNEPGTDDDIWFVEKKNDGWGEPQNLGAPVNTSANERSMSVDHQGTLYFWVLEDLPGGKGSSDIYRSRLVNGQYAMPENLGEIINSKYYEANPSVAPDGSYLLFTSDDRPDGFGKSDIYISYNRNGTWTKPKNLGAKVNSAAFDFSPRISPDGKYLFFSSNRNVHDEGTGKQNIYYISLDTLGLEIPSKKTGSHNPNNLLEIQYLASEGFFIISSNGKVLIDGLYRERVEGYKRIPNDILEKLKKSAKTF